MEKKKEKNSTSIKEKDDMKGQKKRKWSKQIKIIAAVVVIIIVLVIGLWGMHSDKSYPSVSEIVNNKDKYLGKYIEVKGTVKTDCLNTMNRTFMLTDGKNDLTINYTKALPSGFEEGKDVVVKGTLRDQVGLVIEAKEIEVGCASKY